jgi:hypothetical protein
VITKSNGISCHVQRPCHSKPNMKRYTHAIQKSTVTKKTKGSELLLVWRLQTFLISFENFLDCNQTHHSVLQPCTLQPIFVTLAMHRRCSAADMGDYQITGSVSWLNIAGLRRLRIERAENSRNSASALPAFVHRVPATDSHAMTCTDEYTDVPFEPVLRTQACPESVSSPHGTVFLLEGETEFIGQDIVEDRLFGSWDGKRPRSYRTAASPPSHVKRGRTNDDSLEDINPPTPQRLTIQVKHIIRNLFEQVFISSTTPPDRSASSSATQLYISPLPSSTTGASQAATLSAVSSVAQTSLRNMLDEDEVALESRESRCCPCVSNRVYMLYVHKNPQRGAVNCLHIWCIHMHIYTHMYVCMYIHTRARIHSHIHVHTHTQTHMRTRAYTRRFPLSK